MKAVQFNKKNWYCNYLGAKKRSGINWCSRCLIFALSSVWIPVCRFIWWIIKLAASSNIDLSYKHWQRKSDHQILYWKMAIFYIFNNKFNENELTTTLYTNYSPAVSMIIPQRAGDHYWAYNNCFQGHYQKILSRSRQYNTELARFCAEAKG